jgi:hypothetical protein
LCICDIFHTENHLFTLRNRLWISIMLGYTMICRPKWFFVMLTFYLLTQQLTSRLIYDILAK